MTVATVDAGMGFVAAMAGPDVVAGTGAAATGTLPGVGAGVIGVLLHAANPIASRVSRLYVLAGLMWVSIDTSGVRSGRVDPERAGSKYIDDYIYSNASWQDRAAQAEGFHSVAGLRLDHLHCQLYALCASRRHFRAPIPGAESTFKRTLIVLQPELHPEAVIRHGLALARACLSDIVFYTGLARPKPPTSDPPDGKKGAPREPLDGARVRTEQLHRQAQKLAEDLGLLSHSVIAMADNAERGILDTAQARRCELIVLACDGSNAVVRLLNGSSIPGLVTASPVPVMVCAPPSSAGLDHGGTPRGGACIVIGQLPPPRRNLRPTVRGADRHPSDARPPSMRHPIRHDAARTPAHDRRGCRMS